MTDVGDPDAYSIGRNAGDGVPYRQKSPDSGESGDSVMWMHVHRQLHTILKF